MKRNSGILILSAMLSASCGHVGECEVAVTDGRTAVELDISVDGAGTRSVVEGNTFAVGQTYGLFICEHGSYAPHNLGSNNMKALYEGGSDAWSYRFEGGYFSFPMVFIMSNDNGTGADFYAYSPWTARVTNPENIGFTLGGTDSAQADMMWAEQNADPLANKNLIPDGGPAKQVSLRFRHALACLKFGFRVRNDAAPVTLSSIRIRSIDGGAALYGSAVMNAMDGTLTPGESVGDFTVSRYGRVIGSETDYSYAPLLIVPVTPPAGLADEDGVYMVDFTLDDGIYPVYSFSIPLGGIRHDDGTLGFRAGYEYVFDFTIDNYLHLDGVRIDDRWYDGEGADIEI